MEASKIRLTVPEGIDPSRVLGAGDGVLRALESLVRAHVVARGDSISVSGDPDEVELVVRFFEHAFREAAAGRTLSADDVSRCLAVLRDGEHEATSLRDDVLLSYRGRVIRPKTLGQKRYVDAIRSHTITFGLGPAGTGKTYLAMALAVAALKRHEVGRLILTRPVVEAGENLGFLPGTLEEKIDPYMRPLYDALFDMMDRERTDELMEHGVIEIAPLAYMRGRTLNDAFVILDEAQNTTEQQMKMFLTRLGFNTTMVITGDISQVDLTVPRSGLATIERILGGINDIAFVHLKTEDVVRHQLVGQIVAAYDRHSAIAGDHRDIERKGRRNHTDFDARQQADSTNQSETDDER